MVLIVKWMEGVLSDIITPCQSITLLNTTVGKSSLLFSVEIRSHIILLTVERGHSSRQVLHDILDSHIHTENTDLLLHTPAYNISPVITY